VVNGTYILPYTISLSGIVAVKSGLPVDPLAGTDLNGDGFTTDRPGAAISGPSRVDITARWARRLTVYLHDRLVNLDQPLEIRVNGVQVFSGTAARSAPTALSGARASGDERLIFAAAIGVEVPATPAPVAAAERAFDELTPKRSEGTLSFWEMYATRALEERVPALGIDGAEEALPPGLKAAGEQVAVRVRQVAPSGALAAAGLRAGDLLLEVGGEPFFRGRGALMTLHHWLIRELRSEPASYTILAWRDGRRVESNVRLALGPCVEPKPTVLPR
jgi:hypothetical protein